VLLRSLLQRCNATVRSVETCADDQHSLADVIKRSIRYHVLIISGGVSVGEHDIVKSTLLSLGARIDIWRVAIKPGKPFLFGQADSCAIFGLPGNPVSTFITFLQFVRPAVLKMMSASDRELDPRKVTAESDLDLDNDGERAHYVRGRFENGKFLTVGRQESHALFGLSQSNALLRLAPGESMKKGAVVEVHLWD